MSKKKLFHSQRLLKLYQQGKLDDVLEKFSDEINEETFIAAGSDSSSFSYKKGQQVLKLCIKDIGYFKRYGTGLMGLTESQQFKEHINSLMNFFVPIEEILYEDNNVFVYTQNHCQLLKKDKVSPRIVIGIFQMVQFMLKKNILATDIAPHNLGLLNDNIVLFDYHGLHPLKRLDGRIKRHQWWGRLIRNLTRYMSYIYAPQKTAKYAQLMQYVDDNTIKKLRDDQLLPFTYLQLIEYLSINDTKVSIEKIFDLLQDCIITILDSFHFHPKQLSHIHCLCNLCVGQNDNDNDNDDNE